MRFKSFAIAALACTFCGLLVLGTARLLRGNSEPMRALERTARQTLQVEAEGEASLEEVADAESVLFDAQVVEQNPAAADWEGRHSLASRFAKLRVLVRAADSMVELPGAEVRAQSRIHQQAVDGTTGQNGVAELNLPAGADRVDLVIVAEGYVTATVSSIDHASGEHVQDMVSSATIEGFVLGSGDANAVVHLWNESTREIHSTAGHEEPLGDDHAFRFAGLPPGGYALGLELDHRGIDFVANVLVGPGDTETVSLRAPRPGELDLSIVRPGQDRIPVPEARIKLIPDRQGVPRAMENRIGERIGQTDDQGRWRVPGMSPGEWIVEATDGAAKVRRRIEVEEGGRISEVQIALRSAPSLIVRLQGTAGIDPSEIKVFAQEPNELNPSREAVLSPDGSFFFEALPAGVRLKIRAGVLRDAWEGGEDSRPMRSAFVRLKSREEPHELELKLTGPCHATVVVKKSDGTPWEAGAQLGGLGPSDFPETGSYLFQLPAGPAILEAGGTNGFAKKSQRVVVKPGEENRFEITLRSVSEVSGSFKDLNGAALSRLRVRARRQNLEEGQRRDYNTRTNALGEFQLKNLPEGEYLLSAITRFGETGAESAQMRFETPRDSGAFFPLVLPFQSRDSVGVGTLLGRVTTLDGERVSRLRVQNLRGGTVSVDGSRFEIRGLRSGRFNLTLVAEGCLPQVLRDVQLAAGATIDLGTIEFAPSTRVIVDVRGPDNKRLAEARVELRTRKADLEPGQKPARHRVGNRRKDGRYQRERSPRGRFQLIVRREGYETYRRNVTVRDQRQQFFRMKLKKRDSNG